MSFRRTRSSALEVAEVAEVAGPLAHPDSLPPLPPLRFPTGDLEVVLRRLSLAHVGTLGKRVRGTDQQTQTFYNSIRGRVGRGPPKMDLACWTEDDKFVVRDLNDYRKSPVISGERKLINGCLNFAKAALCSVQYLLGSDTEPALQLPIEPTIPSMLWVRDDLAVAFRWLAWYVPRLPMHRNQEWNDQRADAKAGLKLLRWTPVVERDRWITAIQAAKTHLENNRAYFINRANEERDVDKFYETGQVSPTVTAEYIQKREKEIIEEERRLSTGGDDNPWDMARWAAEA